MALASAASLGAAVAWSAGDCQLVPRLGRSLRQVPPCQALPCCPAAPSQALGLAARSSSRASCAALLSATAAVVTGASGRRQRQQLPALAAARGSSGRGRSSGSSSSSSPKRGKKLPSKKTEEDVVVKDSGTVKKLLKELIKEVPNGLGRYADASVNFRIEEVASELEELNRVRFPAKSQAQMLTGEWKLLYSSADAIPAGVIAFGLLKGEASQRIDAKMQQQVSRVSFFGGNLALEWTSTWRVLGESDLSVGREYWFPVLFGFKPIWPSVECDGTLTWTLSYTDRSFRIVRTEKPDRDGVPIADLYVFEKL
eukprot:TRINITY_DN43312_c0_g1_i1.p1 TRINITY_DN43312_c0_g1~~TRINITY_DN43312_c0_g1_i1.p1  ORF type:complete len:312 (-),score=48.42 TRINITY_DN43312_c0_g1_i1:23-958(-)